MLEQAHTTSPTTICAIATPPGGAIGIVRLSGPEAICATGALLRPAGHKPWPTPEGGTVTFGRICDPETGEVVDEVLVSLFRAPHSYTGEDCTEISCHGSAYILNRVIQLLLAQGCRLAKGGEYTERAYLNGKMDLSQAEAVADLIASTTEANHRMAMRQLRGGFSTELRQLRDQLLHLTSLLELELDFSDHEDLEFASRDELTSLAARIHDRISRLCASFRVGNALKRGVPVAIVGETNAGKSTLLNGLVGEERALVSDVHGTTRDTVEECVVAGGTLIRFIDTAGIRQTDDTVERMGIARTLDKIREADLILWLIDATEARAQYAHLHSRLAAEAGDKPVILLINKADLLTERERRELEDYFRETQGVVEHAHSGELRGVVEPAQPGEPRGAAEPAEPGEPRGMAEPAQSGEPRGMVEPAQAGEPRGAAEHVQPGVPRGAAEHTQSGVPCEVAEHAQPGEPNSEVAPVLAVAPIFLSARETDDVARLLTLLADRVAEMQEAASTESGVIVSNARHYEALTQALAAIDRVSDGLANGLSGDFVAQDLRECIYHLSDIVGEVSTDAVLHNIFRHFCVGK